MFLALDVGNTSINIGVFNKSELVCRAKLASDQAKTADEYAVLISGIFAMKGVKTDELFGAIMLSVVPGLTHTLIEALDGFGIEPMLVGAGIRTGLNIRVENPGALGADIVADTVGAMQLAKPPFAVIDLGTATTLTAVNPKGELCGCMIAPGVRLALDALSSHCAMLPDVSLTRPEQLLGTNTADALNAGSVWGTALMLDGFIEALKAEYLPEELTVVATGGLSELIAPHCRSKMIREPELTLRGLCRLWELNHRAQSKPSRSERLERS